MHAVINVILLLGSVSWTAGLDTSKGLIAYDCGADDLNITAISLYRPASCKSSLTPKITERKYIQVIQQKTSHTVRVIQCGLMTERSITHCGMHSHSSMVANSYLHQIKTFTYPECQLLLSTGYYSFDHKRSLRNVKANMTTRGEIVIEGSLDGSSCKGGTYTSDSVTWGDVVVKLKYEFKLYEYYTTANVPEDTIDLRNGLSCMFSKGSCIDSLEGSVTWDTTITSECVKSEFVSLFSGVVNKTYGTQSVNDKDIAIYSTQQASGLFSIRAFDKTEACGYTVLRTDHPKIFIYEVEHSMMVFRSTFAQAKDLDIFTYFNSKITMLESHIQHQLERMYDALYVDLCEIERKILGTQLILAKIYPNDFASDLMRQDGYTAVVAGEVIYLIQCRPVYVTLASTDRCYHEIPVVNNNRTMYMTPMTRILQNEGNLIECSAFLAPKYKFGTQWYTIDGKIRESPSPTTMQSNLRSNWTYAHIPDLMKSGIYTRDQLEQMKHVIYDTSLQRSATTYIKHILEGKQIVSDSFDVRRMLPDDVVDSAIHRYWMKFLGFASWLGHFTTAVIGFYMFGKAVKFIMDTVIHGKILYDIYGLGWQLIAAFWDSFTALLSHRSLQKRHDATDPRMKDNAAADPNEAVDLLETKGIYPQLPTAPEIRQPPRPPAPRYDP
uniref:Glycoprotein n=1 Tax=Mos8Chu0 chuvirus TaxID=2847850 RepID=A0A1L4A1T9_9VIRU|nr:glycoprotein [Mos8Chu0 chuvirus]